MKEGNDSIDLVSGSAFELPGKDVDTDALIPAEFLKCVTFDGLGYHVFAADRTKQGGKHPFDVNQGKGSNILLVGENFGCGSSREHAVPALMQYGLRAIIGLSFAEIFRGNSVGNGLVCVTVNEEDHEEIAGMIKVPETVVTIDLKKMEIEVRLPNGETAYFTCTMAESHRESLIGGMWDDLTVCLDGMDLVDARAREIPFFRYPVLVAV